MSMCTSYRRLKGLEGSSSTTTPLRRTIHHASRTSPTSLGCVTCFIQLDLRPQHRDSLSQHQRKLQTKANSNRPLNRKQRRNFRMDRLIGTTRKNLASHRGSYG